MGFRGVGSVRSGAAGRRTSPPGGVLGEESRGAAVIVGCVPQYQRPVGTELVGGGRRSGFLIGHAVLSIRQCAPPLHRTDSPNAFSEWDTGLEAKEQLLPLQ